MTLEGLLSSIPISGHCQTPEEQPAVGRGPPDTNIRHPPYFADVDAQLYCQDGSYIDRLYESLARRNEVLRLWHITT